MSFSKGKKTFSKMTMKRQYQEITLLEMKMYMVIFIMFIIIIYMNLWLKFLLCLNGKFLNLRKEKIFRYYGFSVTIDVLLCDCR